MRKNRRTHQTAAQELADASVDGVSQPGSR